MIKSKSKKEIGKEPVFNRLGKSIIANQDIEVGGRITIDKLSGKIFLKQHIPVRESVNVIGKTAKCNIKKNQVLSYAMIK